MASQRQGRAYFQELIFFSKIHHLTCSILCTHAVILLVMLYIMYTCSDSTCHALVYAITVNDVCLHLIVPPSSCIAPHFFSAACLTQIGGHTFERKAPFATAALKKGGGLIFGGGPIFGITVSDRGGHSSYC